MWKKIRCYQKSMARYVDSEEDCSDENHEGYSSPNALTNPLYILRNVSNKQDEREASPHWIRRKYKHIERDVSPSKVQGRYLKRSLSVNSGSNSSLDVFRMSPISKRISSITSLPDNFSDAPPDRPAPQTFSSDIDSGIESECDYITRYDDITLDNSSISSFESDTSIYENNTTCISSDMLTTELDSKGYKVTKVLHCEKETKTIVVIAKHGEREVVLKCLLRNKDFTPKNEYLREVEFYEDIVHPYVTQYYGSFLTIHYSCIIMEKGEMSLFDYCIHPNPLWKKTYEKWIYQIMTALRFIHSQGWVLLDLKIDNIILVQKDKEYVAKLCDFGYAHHSNKTLVKACCGSIGSAAPEQFIGTNAPFDGEKADIWGLGVVVYELVFDRIPFGNHFLPKDVTDYVMHLHIDKEGHVTVKNQKSKRFHDLDFSNSNKSMKQVVLQCLCVDPQERSSLNNLLCMPCFIQETKKICIPRRPRAYSDSYHRVSKYI